MAAATAPQGATTQASASPAWRIAPLGDRCLVVEFGHRVDPEIACTVRSFAAHLLGNPPEGVLDVVPTFTTVAVHYRPQAFTGPELPHVELRRQLEALLAHGVAGERVTARVVEVPVCYGGEFGPDLDEVAAACRLSPQEVIGLHGASPHVVYMLGFAPGFPYIGGLDERLAVPRRSTPRTAIPAGSVAIARDQSVIYPLETPGGWNLIGRTPLPLFDASAEPPCLLQPGDEVRFVPVSLEQFQDMTERLA